MRFCSLLLVLCSCTFIAQAADFKVAHRQTILLFGDSITVSGEFGQIMQDFIDQQYPERMISIAASGASGHTVQDSIKRIENDIVRWKPDWVVIHLGTNDMNRFTPEQYLRHYEYMINRIMHATGAGIVIVSPIRGDREGSMDTLDGYAKGLQLLAQKYKLQYAPLFEVSSRLRPEFPKGVKYAVDGSHPNRIGYTMMAQVILQALDFPFAAKSMRLEEPARRTTVDRSDALSGTKFHLDLPVPLDVELTSPALPVINAPRAEKPIVLDGELGEWAKSNPMTVGAREQQYWGIVSRNRYRPRATAYATYDAAGLYLAFDVEDSEVVIPENPATVVDRDCLEVHIDGRSAEVIAKTPYTNLDEKSLGVLQYIVAPRFISDSKDKGPEAMVMAGMGDRNMLTGVKAAARLTTYGYTVEMFLPAALFPDKLQAGSKVGFDWTLDDVGRFGRYIHATGFRWTGSSMSAFHNREFGSIHLR